VSPILFISSVGNVKLLGLGCRAIARSGGKDTQQVGFIPPGFEALAFDVETQKIVGGLPELRIAPGETD
jgi:hypothetical protein